MKKIVLFIICVFSCILVSNAQLKKRTWLVGGSGSFYSYTQELKSQITNDEAKYTEINLNASLGYFAIDKLALGAKSSFSYLKGRDGAFYSPTRFLLGPNVRYYFLNADKPFNIVANIDYQTGIYKNPTEDTDYKGKIYSYSAMAGMEAFFNSSVGLELLFGYRRFYEGFENTPGGGYSDDRKGLFINIGFQLHLAKK